MNFLQEIKPYYKKEDIQSQIDNWHIDHKDEDFNLGKYKAFLTDIGYLAQVQILQYRPITSDPEIKTIAGPQLVVPVMNARFALNAQCRWGSLYDALYGTDVISEDDGAEKSWWL